MTKKEKELNCLNCRIGDFKQNLCDCHNGFCAKYKGIGTENDLFKAIEALSTEAVQGKWIRIGHDIYECSLCHQNVMTKDIDCYSYCHQCGAKMKGDNLE
jgi:hypothetical protein